MYYFTDAVIGKMANGIRRAMARAMLSKLILDCPFELITCIIRCQPHNPNYKRLVSMLRNNKHAIVAQVTLKMHLLFLRSRIRFAFGYIILD